MKIILSRKGLDSANGRCASPLLPDGRMYSIPIKGIGEPVLFADIAKGSPEDQSDLGNVVECLTQRRYQRHHSCHFDPDLDESAMPRLPGWCPAFGQASGAQGHLATNGVGIGDVFLFFGWFRGVECWNGRWSFKRGAPNLHVLFGWLQIGEVVVVPGGREAEVLATHPWLEDHPHLHLQPGEINGVNAIYVASDELILNGRRTGLPGGGEFRRYSDQLLLTKPSRTRCFWRLPSWFLSPDGVPRLSYHGNPPRGARFDDHVQLKTVGRGQEFVMDCSSVNEAADWIEHVVRAGSECTADAKSYVPADKATQQSLRCVFGDD